MTALIRASRAHASPDQHQRRGPPGVALLGAPDVCALFAAISLILFATYARLPIAELPGMTRGGVAGGAIRVLIFLNFPAALVAIAFVGIAVARWSAPSGGLDSSERCVAGPLALLAVALCLIVVYPGVVPESPLVARPINALPVLGVLLAVALLVRAFRASREPARAWKSGGGLRLGAIVLLLLALPWLLADLGVYVDDVPGLGALFLSQQVTPGEVGPAVHLGHHHGLDGALLVIAALALIPELVPIGKRWLRQLLGAYLALMLVYGLANAVQDFWLEQIVRRGWAATAIPDVLWPAPTRAWGILLLIAAIAWPIALRVARPAGTSLHPIDSAGATAVP